MSEEWRTSEAQVIAWDRWTRLNGSDTEILIPREQPGGGSGVVIRVRRALPSGPGATTIPLYAPITEAGTYVFEIAADGSSATARKVG